MDEELVRSLAAGTRLPESILQEARVHPRFKNSRFVMELQKHLAQTRKAADAQNLSSEKRGRPKGTPAQHAAIRKAADDREKGFAPIQRALEQRFGMHAAKFMLSNRVVNDLLNGSLILAELPAYRQALIRDIAAESGLDLESYDSGTKIG
jgi:hypothetical protein